MNRREFLGVGGSYLGIGALEWVLPKGRRREQAKKAFTHPGNPSATVDLRGYGRVKFARKEGMTLFLCENVQKADILLGKLMADLFWDAEDGHRILTVSIHGRKAPFHVWEPYGCIFLARNGSEVIAIGAATEQQMRERMKREPICSDKDSVFTPPRAYPLYLDFYDLRAFKCYAHAMSSPREQGLKSHWEFIKKFRLGGLAFQSPGFWTNCPAPDVLNFSSVDYEVREAEINKGMFVLGPTAGGEAPLWVHNRHPFAMMQPSSTTLLGAWGGEGAAGAHFESWGIADDQRDGLPFLRHVMERYRNSPALGGWQPYTGSPGAEMSMHYLTCDFWDHSAAGRDGFRTFLRDVKGYKLASIGERWHGDSRHYRSWSELNVPDLNTFFMPKGSMLLGMNWMWRLATADEKSPPKMDDPNWTAVAMPPSQQLDFYPKGDAFFKVQFNGDNGKTKYGKDGSYLACCAYSNAPQGLEIWFNGVHFGGLKTKDLISPIVVNVSSLLKAEGNELIIHVPGDGRIYGPVFLAPSSPNLFPYLGKHGNARYADLREWQAYGIHRLHRQVMHEARSLDSERSFILSGGDMTLMDYSSELSAVYGMGLQMTGREAWYFPWHAGLGYVAGYYGTGEPSATTSGDNLKRMLGWIMIDGDGNHDLFWDVEDYILEEKNTGFFTKNQILLRLFGKYLRVKPDLAILHSAVTHRLGDGAPWVWDLGRGELQSMHYDNVYATERELKLHLTNDYPVLLDSGTEFMDDEVLHAIREYVEQGGTFVALHNTGRHSLIEPDTWRISQITGFKVMNVNQSGKLRFASTPVIMQSWSDKEFEGDGIALERMEETEGHATGLAYWEDGTIAMGYRTLGKGRVIVLGSSFWRSGRDVSGVWKTNGELESAFIDGLFSDIGIRRNATASHPDIWARKNVTKNGLQDWLVAFNNSETPTTAELSIYVGEKPEEVRDMETKRNVPFEYDNGWVRISNAAFEGFDTRVFGMKRANLQDGIPIWWGEKTKYWKRCADTVNSSKSLPMEPHDEKSTIAFQQWRFFADRDLQVSSKREWLGASFADHHWKTTISGPWNLLDNSMADYHGVGLYRSEFVVPKAWKGRRIILGLYDFNNPIVYDEGEFFLNGVSVAVYKARGWSQTLGFDVTPHIRNGKNVLAIKVQGGKEFSGVSGAIWLAPEISLNPMQPLDDKWSLNKVNRDSAAVPSFPCQIHAKYLSRDVNIPLKWKGRSIYLHIETQTQWLGSVVVNGGPINYNSYVHPFGTIADINITPLALPGGANRIELWPFSCIAGSQEADMDIGRIMIGCV